MTKKVKQLNQESVKRAKKSIRKVVLEYRRQSRKDVLRALIENFGYGFTQMAVPTMISLSYDVGIIVTMMIYYSFLSIVINRKKYDTILGRHIIFPGACALGGYMGYTFASFVESII